MEIIFTTRKCYRVDDILYVLAENGHYLFQLALSQHNQNLPQPLSSPSEIRILHGGNTNRRIPICQVV